MSTLRILITGSMGPIECPAAYRNAFARLGHSVSEVNVDEHYRVGLFNRVLNRALKPIAPTPDFWGTQLYNDLVIGKAREVRPDFILFCRPVYIQPKTLREIKEELGCQIYSWFPDDAFYPANGSRFFYDAMPLYDCHFTTKSFNVVELLANGAKRAEFLPHAVAADCLYPVKPSAEELSRFGADVGFVGTWAQDRRVEYLERLCEEGYKVKVFGNSWEKLDRGSALRKAGAVQFRAVYGEEMSRIFHCFKITTAFLRAHNRDVQTVRTYEIPACGAFMLHERTAEATEIFREGIEAEFFGEYREFRDKVDLYLKNTDAREQIARKGYERSRRPDVSYEARANAILSVFKAFASSRSKAG